MMASFERRFLTIKVTKFAYTEVEVLVNTMVITGNSWYVYFYLWFVVCKFCNDFRCWSVIIG